MNTVQDAIQRAAGDARDKQIEDDRKQLIESFTKILSTTFSESQKYTNVILVAGYAGFFSIWSSMKDKLPAAPMFIAAALVTISAGVFVAFEIYKMVSNHMEFLGINTLLEQLKGNVAEALTAYQRQSEQGQFRLFAIWRYVLIVTCGTGLAAWGILVVYFILGAFGAVNAACWK